MALFPRCAFIALPLLLVSITPADGDEAEKEKPTYLKLQSGNLTLSIDPKMGGRMASLTLDGDEILKTTRDENNWHWGSTVWLAPQSDWGWPPPTILDSEPYRVVESDDTKIVLRSELEPKSQCQLTKKFELIKNAKEQTVARMTYTVTNRGDQPTKVALWENTRVVWDGVTRFPSGSKIRLSKEDRPIQLVEGDVVTGLRFNEQQPNAQKVFVTPPVVEGKDFTWNSFVLGDLILTKSRKHPGKVAPEQAPLEIYLAPDDGFAELENQGPYEEVAPGESARMVVLWRLRKAE